MPSSDPARAPGRPRSPAVHEALLTATQDLLIAVGFDRLSVDAVAARVGASKHTIYRRWPNKTELVVAAVERSFNAPEVPDLGSLRADLLACGRSYIQDDDRTQRLLAGLLTEMVRNEHLRRTARRVLGTPYAELFPIVISRAVHRGLVDPGVDIATVSEIFPAFAFHRVAVAAQPVDEELVRRVIERCVLPLLPSPSAPQVTDRDRESP